MPLKPLKPPQFEAMVSDMTYMSKSRNKRENDKTPRTPKSSPEARRLIEMAVTKCGSERAAAEYLGLPNHGQLHKMRAGLLHDTPEMIAEIKRRRIRAKKAYNKSFYSMHPNAAPNMIDLCPTLKVLKREIEPVVTMIDRIVMQCERKPQ